MLTQGASIRVCVRVRTLPQPTDSINAAGVVLISFCVAAVPHGPSARSAPNPSKRATRPRRCDADAWFADELTSQRLYEEYIAMNRPVLIRGLLSLTASTT